MSAKSQRIIHMASLPDRPSNAVIAEACGVTQGYVSMVLSRKRGIGENVLHIQLSDEYKKWLDNEAIKLRVVPADVAIAMLNDSIAEAMTQEQGKGR